MDVINHLQNVKIRSPHRLLQMKVDDMRWEEKKLLVHYLDELCDYCRADTLPQTERQFIGSPEGKKLETWAKTGMYITFFM